ncbi:nodulation protein NfeD [Roseivirga sp. BDSF3-8]|uniref:NfeD family protein n=1 Tax=Roseivirga sp. BDSF3-8 TaxID=3241598 RepID=UPI0035319871
MKGSVLKGWLTSIFLLIAIASGCLAQSSPTKVFVFGIQSEIDPRTNRKSELALEEAREVGADMVIIEMNTYGGALNDADEIRTRILNYEIPIYVFINKNAASAGALISIACDSIYMASGASIGAATVVNQTGDAAPDKYQSYMRSIMRSTAEATGRNPEIAEAMVDENLVVDSISEAGSVITFSTTEAMRYGFCEGRVSSVEDILVQQGVYDYEITEYTLSTTDKIIAFFLNPFVSGFLIMIILGGIYFELQTPGVGFPILAALIALVLYLVPYYLHGLAENWELITFALGLVLLALEVFVIPGFGIAGIGGLILTLGSLVLMMVGNDGLDFSFVPMSFLIEALSSVMVALLAAVVLIIFLASRMSSGNSAFINRFALADTQDREQGYVSAHREISMLGMTGKAYTVLRPSGKVLIDGQVYDAFTRGDYIQEGDAVVVTEETGSSLKVKLLEETTPDSVAQV